MVLVPADKINMRGKKKGHEIVHQVDRQAGHGTQSWPLTEYETAS
jgi:hypothetical protein